MNYEILKQKRLSQGLSRDQIADMLEVKHITIKKYEQGKIFPRSNDLKRFADVYRLSKEELLYYLDIV